jgi:hypothetical protein
LTANSPPFERELERFKKIIIFRALNNVMQKQKKLNGHGGARPGAGRPRGTTDRVTIAGLLGAIETATGQTYTELLAEDFVTARAQDRGLAQKYHNLILNKVAASLTAVEVTDSEAAIDAKRRAFEAALTALAQAGRP